MASTGLWCSVARLGGLSEPSVGYGAGLALLSVLSGRLSTPQHGRTVRRRRSEERRGGFWVLPALPDIRRLVGVARREPLHQRRYGGHELCGIDRFREMNLETGSQGFHAVV